jgi:hypothetical protein
VTLNASTTICRVVFMHGRNFDNDGWFDTTAGKPKLQIYREKKGAAETIGELTDYPATTATNNANLPPAQTFTLQLAEPVSVLAVHASGNNPKQNFSSRAELQAFRQ